MTNLAEFHLELFGTEPSAIQVQQYETMQTTALVLYSTLPVLTTELIQAGLVWALAKIRENPGMNAHICLQGFEKKVVMAELEKMIRALLRARKGKTEALQGFGAALNRLTVLGADVSDKPLKLVWVHAP